MGRLYPAKIFRASLETLRASSTMTYKELSSEVISDVRSIASLGTLRCASNEVPSLPRTSVNLGDILVV